MKNHVTSLELSKKLKEAGLELESQFYWAMNFSDEWQIVRKPFALDAKPYPYPQTCPAYLATELLEVLKNHLFILYYSIAIKKYVIESRQIKLYLTDKHLLEALGNLYLQLKKEGLI